MFAGAFWSPFNFCKSNVEELLNKENLILEDILDDDNILSDLKSNNDKFGKYLHRHPQFVKSLVDYIIKEPKDDESDFKICYKYPFVSSEILACEILGLIKAFFEDAADCDSHMSLSHNFDQASQESGNKESNDKEEDESKVKRTESVGIKKEAAAELKEEMDKLHLKDEKHEMVGVELLDYLLSFLENKEKYLNQTLAGYFQKALNAIMNKRGFDMLNHLFEKFEYLKLMIDHSINKSIVDLLIRILFIDIPFIDAKMTLFLEQRKEVMSLLLTAFDQTTDYEEADNISFLFCDLISKYKNVNAGKELIESLNTPNNLSILFNKLFCKNPSIIASSCNIIIHLIRFFMSKDVQSNMDNSTLSESTKSPMKELKQSSLVTIESEYHGFFHLLEKQTELLIQALNMDKLIPNFNSTFGQEITPFGAYRLKILEIITLLIKVGAPFEFPSIFCKFKIFEIILDLSMTFEFNTFLHGICEKIIVDSVETENEELLKSLFYECRCTAKLIEGITQKDFIISKPNRSVKRGFKAYFIKISNFLVKAAVNFPFLNEILTNDEAWKNFVGTELENINVEQNRDLGGHNPKKAPQQEEDDNYKIEIDIKKIYEKFSQYFQNGPVKEKKDDLDNEIEDDFDKESPPQYASPEKNKVEDEEAVEETEIDQQNTLKKNSASQESPDFNSCNFWKTVPQHKIEDLLKEL